MDLSEILSAPPTGLAPGASPESARRSHGPPPLPQPPPPASAEPPTQSRVLPPPNTHPQEQGQIPGDQIWQSLSLAPPSDASYDSNDSNADEDELYYIDQDSDLWWIEEHGSDSEYIYDEENDVRMPNPRPRWRQNGDNAVDAEEVSSDDDIVEISSPSPSESSPARRPAAQSSQQSSPARPPPDQNSTRKRPRPSSTQGSSPTRAKRTRAIPEIDLVDEDSDSIAAVLSKQRADQVQAQNEAAAEPAGPTATKLTATSCSVCMSQPREAIATVCGHVFCRQCLMQWVTHNSGQGRKRPTCPSCRAPISTAAGARGKYPTMVNLEFKRKAAAST